MTGPINPFVAATNGPPVVAVHEWLEGVRFPTDLPLLNVSQAAPTEPPPKELRAVIADAALNDPLAHLYGPILGMPELRTEIATQWSRDYSGTIQPDNVAITSGCNQAFTAVMTTLAAQGDEILIPTPWYFNHKMHLDMAGAVAVPIPTGSSLLPDPSVAKSLITDKTRAIVLVTPNNPGGVEYSAQLVRSFYDLAKKHGVSLILDETYRDFDGRSDPAHDLFGTDDWSQTLIQLYSFSKSYRLTGHRVGAVVASPARLTQVEKYLDTVSICPNQLAQRAALWGMQNLGDWLQNEREIILERRKAIAQGFAALPGWDVLGLGAFFAYVRHPFSRSSDEIAREMAQQAGILLMPGTMFKPRADTSGQQELRLAFANIDHDEIKTLFSRLENLHL